MNGECTTKYSCAKGASWLQVGSPVSGGGTSHHPTHGNPVINNYIIDINLEHMALHYSLSYDKVSAIVEVSLPLAAYFDIPQNGAKTDFFKQNHQLL